MSVETDSDQQAISIHQEAKPTYEHIHTLTPTNLSNEWGTLSWNPVSNIRFDTCKLREWMINRFWLPLHFPRSAYLLSALCDLSLKRADNGPDFCAVDRMLTNICCVHSAGLTSCNYLSSQISHRPQIASRWIRSSIQIWWARPSNIYIYTYMPTYTCVPIIQRTNEAERIIYLNARSPKSSTINHFATIRRGRVSPQRVMRLCVWDFRLAHSLHLRHRKDPA